MTAKIRTEIEVYKLMCLGHTRIDISAKLNITVDELVTIIKRMRAREIGLRLPDTVIVRSYFKAKEEDESLPDTRPPKKLHHSWDETDTAKIQKMLDRMERAEKRNRNKDLT